ncbi:MAG: DUF47 domain-containing protein [Dehalococcoidia bacterium]|nr:DUF47 domain-containing protein [Dehalococcoidia bacterium]
MARLSFLPREEKFFILFDQSARNILKISNQLKDMMDLWENVRERVAMITDFEHQGDAITHQIMDLLNRVFGTPFDREDIVTLAYLLDDITDSIHAAAETMLIYNVERPVEMARRLADIIVQAAVEVEETLSEIHIRIDRQKITKRCIKINRLENMGDHLYRIMMSELFDTCCDMTKIIKWREIYGYMENALDKCEDVANVLEGISIKYA